jgi:hypothetical protein
MQISDLGRPTLRALIALYVTGLVLLRYQPEEIVTS